MKLFSNPVVLIVLVRTVQASAIGMALHWLLHWPLVGPHALGLLLTPVLCLYFVFVFVGSWSWGLPILTRLPTHQKMVALTFDDGPSAENTQAILDILKAYQVTAAFFMLGECAEKHPELVQHVIADGHQSGIHGDSHQPLALASQKRVHKEMRSAANALGSACPSAPNMRWMRPPYGFKSVALPFFIRRSEYRMAAWSINSRDYATGNPEEIARHVLRKLHPGAILLLHDGPGNAATVSALPLILAGLHARGYECTALPSGG